MEGMGSAKDCDGNRSTNLYLPGFLFVDARTARDLESLNSTRRQDKHTSLYSQCHSPASRKHHLTACRGSGSLLDFDGQTAIALEYRDAAKR